MLRLYLLGRLELTPTDRGDPTAVLSQPKRLAFLAFLAVSAGTYQRRDTLLALFWPELDEFGARRALRNTLYQLRLTLGDGVIVSRGDDEVTVDHSALWCDAAALREAVSAARYEEAIELYRGELLQGFHVDNVGETFETWLARERAQALAFVLQALDARVKHYEHERDGAAAAQCALRATDLAPLDERWVRRAATALDAVGDKSGALRLADAFVRRMATELEARPSAETLGLIDRLRSAGGAGVPSRLAVAVKSSGAAGAAVGVRATTTPSSSALDAASADATPMAAAAVDAAPAAAAPVAIEAARRPTGWRWYWRAAFLALIGLIAAGALAISKRPHPTAGGRARVLITLFENRTGDAALDPLSDMTVDWLARGLLGVQLVEVVDPRALLARGRTRNGQPEDPGQLAHRIGAAFVVTGSYYRSGDSLLFVAGIVDGEGRVLRTVGPLAASLARPVDAVEATRARVMTALVSLVDPRLRGDWTFNAAPPPFEAYEPYVAGRDAFWLGQFAKAESLFALSVSRDTAFDEANVSVAVAAANLLHCAVVDSVARALARRDRSLNAFDGLNMRIATARCHGRNDEMFRLVMQRAQALSPTSPAQLSTANAALWANRPADAVAILERLNPAVDLDWMPTPDYLNYWASLTEGDHMMGRHVAELAAVDRSRMIGLGKFLYRGRALAGLGRSADALSVLDSAFSLPSEPGLSNGMAIYTDGRPEYTGSAAWVGLWIARELHVHGDSVAGRKAAARTFAWLEALPREDRDAPEIRLFEVECLEQIGALHDATRVVQQLIVADTANLDYRGLLAGLAAATGDTVLANRLDASLAALPSGRALWGASFYRARVASLRGRPADAVALVRETLARGAWPYWIHLDPALHRLATRPDSIALTAPRP